MHTGILCHHRTVCADCTVYFVTTALFIRPLRIQWFCIDGGMVDTISGDGTVEG